MFSRAPLWLSTGLRSNGRRGNHVVDAVFSQTPTDELSKTDTDNTDPKLAANTKLLLTDVISLISTLI